MIFHLFEIHKLNPILWQHKNRSQPTDIFPPVFAPFRFQRNPGDLLKVAMCFLGHFLV